eukprot:TRINITY_DN2366_c0_g1_i2.p1 TRINITY_DN2366_c0_g1~~TRINITY_DN2366_c0_g1_i2.p1  ORF type:complete len:152 (-),score=30.35 TRINITY_DN2366_c0_g1_i2:522-977(-)
MKKIGRLRAALMREKSEDVLLCPKPRRLSVIVNRSPDMLNPVAWEERHASEHDEQYAGTEIIDIFLNKENGPVTSDVGCSSPYYCGTPPSRANNPLVNDEHFNHQRLPGSPIAMSKSNSCSRSSYGSIPAIHIEGFDCLDRDTRCSVPAIA